ncbi:MAG: hypothetical protein GC178_10835 [Flavobacteriales bacterium]|nr:hypothetical protein [Flavobacteriales bacterium]
MRQPHPKHQHVRQYKINIPNNMKKLLLSLLFPFSFFLLPALAQQAPQKFNYQAVARDADGKALSDSEVILRIAIMSGNDLDRPVYSEEHTVTTNKLGLFNLAIGAGEILEGEFSTIDWGADSHYLSVEMDAEGYGHFQQMGTSQLLSVPYALYAERSGSGNDGGSRNDPNDWTINGNAGTDDSVNFIGTLDAQDLTIRTNDMEVARFTTDGELDMDADARITFGGENALHMLGDLNVSIGPGAGDGIAAGGSGERNAFIGDHAGSKVTSGSRNAFIGYYAGYNTTTGNNNIAIGNAAGYKNQSGSNNTNIGFQSGYNAVDVSNNIYIGFQAGYNTTTGGNNSYVGFQAGRENLIGTANSYFGTSSGRYATGSSNTFLGYRTGFATTTGAGNTFLGTNAGDGNTTGSSNTYIGANADGSPTLSNATAIGAGATVTQSNSLVLGSSANVGIGTSAPSAKLHVEGTMKLVDGNQADGYVLTSDASGNASWQATATAIEIADADGDTKIQVEESADEDIIRFDMAGTEFFRMDSGRLEVLNTGSSVFLGELAGASDDLDYNSNTALGYLTLNENETGAYNVVVGSQALQRGNVNNNTAVGYWSLRQQSFPGNVGDENTALGYKAGYGFEGSNSVLLGAHAGESMVGDNKLYIENSNADSSAALIYGEFDNDFLAVNGTLRINNGTQADGYVLTSDSVGNANWTAASSLPVTSVFDTLNGVVLPGSMVDETADDFVFGSPQLDDDGNTDHDSRFFFDKGKGAFRAGLVNLNEWDASNIGNYSFASGYGTTAKGISATALGYLTDASGVKATALGSQTTASGDVSTAMGTSTVASGVNATAMGFNTTASGGYSTTMGLFSTASGYSATSIGHYTKAPSAYEVTIGRYSTNYTPSNSSDWDLADRLFTIGNGTGSSNRSDAMVVLKSGEIGVGTSTPDTTLHVVGQIKYEDGNQADGYVLTSDADGNASWQSVATSAELTDADGDTKIQVEESADEDIIRFDIAGSERLTIGTNAYGYTNIAFANDPDDNTFIGRAAGISNSSGTLNVFLGGLAGEMNTSGGANTFIGRKAGSSNTTGSNNTFVGNIAGRYQTTETENTFIGSSSGYNASSGGANVYIGYQSGFNATNGASNVYIGNGAGRECANGTHNIFIGKNAGYNETGSNKLYIANSNTSTPLIYGEFDNDLLLVNGELNVTNGLEVNTTDGTTETKLLSLLTATGRNFDILTPDTADLNSPFVFKTGNSFLFRVDASDALTINQNGNVGIFATSPTYALQVNGTAAKTGGGSWTATSDRRLKQDINEYSDGLEALMQIRPVTYHYNEKSGYDTEPEYVGVIAQELQEIAPYMVGNFEKDGTEYLNVDNSAMTYMLINAVKELKAENDALKAELSAEKASNSSRLERIEAQLGLESTISK